MEFLYEYGLFFAKVFTLVIALIVALVAIFAVANKQKGGDNGNLELVSLSDGFEDLSKMGKEALLSKEELKKLHKQKKRIKERNSSTAINTCLLSTLMALLWQKK